jgi:hypothetical protein
VENALQFYGVRVAGDLRLSAKQQLLGAYSKSVNPSVTATFASSMPPPPRAAVSLHIDLRLPFSPGRAVWVRCCNVERVPLLLVYELLAHHGQSPPAYMWASPRPTAYSLSPEFCSRFRPKSGVGDVLPVKLRPSCIISLGPTQSLQNLEYLVVQSESNREVSSQAWSLDHLP